MIIGRAINKINPKAKYQYTDINNITWLEGTIPISKSEIEAKIIELQAEYDSKKYQRDRAKDYPSIQEQLDMQYWDKINGTNKWQQAINAVKQKYPK
jgi:hypothetical protein